MGRNNQGRGDSGETTTGIGLVLAPGTTLLEIIESAQDLHGGTDNVL